MDDTSKTIFQTPRLTARSFAQADWKRLQEFGGRAEVARMMASLKSPWPKDDVVKWLSRAPYLGNLGFGAGLYLNGTDLIGFVGIGDDPVNCAYAIDPDYWGRGYATEALRGLLAHCFTHLGLKTVTADHFDDNPVSGHVLRKLGFEEIGMGMGYSMARPSSAPVVLFELTREQFNGSD